MAHDFETSLIYSDAICVEQMVVEVWLLEFEVALNASSKFKTQLVFSILLHQLSLSTGLVVVSNENPLRMIRMQ